MDDLIAFLNARYDEREAVAVAAQGTIGGGGHWRQEDPFREPGRIVDDCNDTVTYDEGAPTEEQARHVADNDPAFVLADVAAKRQIIDWHSSRHTVVDDFCVEEGGPCTHAGESYCQIEGFDDCRTLRLLALPYAGHPDYREEWKP